MVEIGAHESALFLHRRVVFCITRLRLLLVVVVVAPFREMVCEFETRSVSGCVFEVDDYELFMGVCW